MSNHGPLEVTLLIFTDGRGELLTQTLQSFDARVVGSDLVTRRIMIDDSANAAYANWLDETFQDYLILHHAPRRGFGGAVAHGWDALEPCDYVFHLEDDFLFTRDVFLGDLTHLLRVHPQLAQMALVRQAWSPLEKQAGGYVALYADAYTDRETDGLKWLENTRCFTTNPCLYPYALTRRGWIQQPESEGKMTAALRAAGYTFGLMGARTDAPWVEHIGAQRVGNGY